MLRSFVVTPDLLKLKRYFSVLQALAVSYLNSIATYAPFAPFRAPRLALACTAIDVGNIRNTHPDLSVVIASTRDPVHACTSLVSHALPEGVLNA